MGVNRKEDVKKDLKEPTPHAGNGKEKKTMKHFTAEELYDIAKDECKKAGMDFDAEGAGQWATLSAEYDDFHSEDEAREEIRSFIAEEKAMMD